MPEKAKTLKSKADKGYEANDADMVEDGGDSSGFEDVDSDEESETQEVSEPVVVTKSSKSKSSKSKK